MNRTRLFRYPAHALTLVLYTLRGIGSACSALSLEWQIWWAGVQQVEASWK
jgi:hypothetical protein